MSRRTFNSTHRRLALLAAVAGTFIAGAAEPGVRVITDVTYLAADRTEKLDLYLPTLPIRGKQSPAVVWVHGGGWTQGLKGTTGARAVCGALVDAGYVVASIDYKLGASSWPQNLLDCKNAIRFLRARATEYQVDPARIAVAGASAGGHLALMVGLTAGEKEFEPVTPYPGLSNAVRCVIDFYGPTNLLTWQETTANGEPTGRRKVTSNVLAAFGATSEEADVFQAASPVAHVTRNSPPVLILHGRADAMVDYLQSVELAGVLQRHGVEHEFLLLEGIGHTFYFETWQGKPLPKDLRPVVLAFLTKHMEPEGK